tara:strand:- start:962 stop:1099 length:138 start_codon:yes stop_codon:yes gene_type:complete
VRKHLHEVLKELFRKSPPSVEFEMIAAGRILLPVLEAPRLFAVGL